MAARIRAFRSYGTNAELRESLREFRRFGTGFAASTVPAAQSRISGLAADLEGVRAERFDKFVARCLTLSGESMLPLADEVQERQALAQACRDLPSDSPFFASRRYPGFVRRLATALAELREWRFSADEMERLAGSADSWLAAKLESLAALDRALRATLKGAAREFEADHRERCLKAQLSSDANLRLWLFAGSDDSPLLADWLRWASSQGVEIWLAVDGHPNSPGLFRGANRLLQTIGVESTFAGRRGGLAEGLFSDQASLDPGVEVRILSAADALAETEWALRTIAEGVEGGSRWERASIYVRDAESYAPLLRFAAQRFGVPLRLARREPLAENGFVRFVLRLLRSADAASPKGLGDLAESSYVGNSAETAAHHRNAIQLASAEHDPWDGLAGRIVAENPSDRWLADALRWNGKRGLEDVAFPEWADEFVALTQEGWLAAALDLSNPARPADLAARNAWIRAVEERSELPAAADRAIDLAEFLDEIETLAAQTEYTIASGEEGLPVVSNAYALGGAETVCVLGMVEGAFPRRRSEDPILSDFEREEIDSLRPDRPALSRSHGRAAAERDEFVRLAAAAGRELVLMYPLVEEERDNTPAFYLSEVRRAAGGNLTESSLSAARLTPPPEECLFASDRNLDEALRGGRIALAPPDLSGEAARQLVEGLPEEGLSPSELRDAARCPFQFVFKRRLKLFAVRDESRWWRLRQLPQTVGLARQPDAEAARRELERALEAELEAMAPDLDPADERLIRSGARRLIAEWVEREFTAREVWPKDPGTEALETAFGEEGVAGELPVGDEQVKLRGRFGAVADMKGYAVGQLYGTRRLPAERGLDKIEDDDLLDLGTHLFALARRHPDTALEVDTLGGERVLYLLPRRPDVQLESRTGQKVRIVDLGEKKPFYDRLKRVLGETVRRIQAGTLTPRAGDHCRTCDYGELCRSAQDWGEIGALSFEEEVGNGD